MKAFRVENMDLNKYYNKKESEDALLLNEIKSMVEKLKEAGLSDEAIDKIFKEKGIKYSEIKDNEEKEEQNVGADTIAEIQIEKKIIKENAIEITDENFDIRIMGVPTGFELAKSIKNKDDKEENNAWNFYQMMYDGQKDDKFYLYRNGTDNITYIYKKSNMISAIARPGSFFAMSLELPKGIYCTDINELQELFDQVFEKILVEKYGFFNKTTSGKYKYNENIDSFDSQFVKQVQKEIRLIMLNNLRNTFSEDFKEIDEEFKKTIKPNKLFGIILGAKQEGTKTKAEAVLPTETITIIKQAELEKEISGHEGKNESEATQNNNENESKIKAIIDQLKISIKISKELQEKMAELLLKQKNLKTKSQ